MKLDIVERTSEKTEFNESEKNFSEVIILSKEKIVVPYTFSLSDGTKRYRILKRIIDVTLSFVGILLLLPLFFLIGIIIKLEDKNSPIFFKQTRVGKNGDLFEMYKFRSMINNAEELLKDLIHRNEVEGAMFKIKDDPRITKIGHFIRKTSIDELPQLINVLKGEMSLVGPRPPLINEVSLYSDHHKQRLCVIPGCTGLWQATVRNSVGFEEMVELDIHYIKNKSILYDIKIIFLTLKSLLKNNAY